MVKGKRLTQREGGENFSIYLRSTLVAKLADYEDIGTVEELRELKEKATTKKPTVKGIYILCPSCGKSVAQMIDRYCSCCGQALDWEA